MNDRRAGVLLAFLLFGQLVLLSAQVPDRQRSGTLLSATGLRLSGPIARWVDSVIRLVASVEKGFLDRRSLRVENRQLRAEVERLRQFQEQRRGLESKLQLALDALDYESPVATAVATAEVVYVDHRSWLKTLAIYVPEKVTGPDLLAVGAPITTHEGLVGRAVAVRGRYARVQMITDRSSSVGGMLGRTRRQGIVRGSGAGELGFDYVPLQDDVKVGDQVLTAGIDGVYPRGIPIGTVVSVSPSDDLFHQIRVVPAVDFGHLDSVFVLPASALPAGFGDVDDTDG